VLVNLYKPKPVFSSTCSSFWFSAIPFPSLVGVSGVQVVAGRLNLHQVLTACRHFVLNFYNNSKAWILFINAFYTGWKPRPKERLDSGSRSEAWWCRSQGANLELLLHPAPPVSWAHSHCTCSENTDLGFHLALLIWWIPGHHYMSQNNNIICDVSLFTSHLLQEDQSSD
jgi:hypothetical protein